MSQKLLILGNLFCSGDTLGHNQLIIWFASAARPNLELKN